MADSRIRDALFGRPDLAKAERDLIKLIQSAAGVTSIGAHQILLARVRDQTEPRHPVTRWA